MCSPRLSVRLVFLRWGGLDLVRLLLSSSPRTAFEARLQQAGMVCLLDMAALRKTHQAELSVRRQPGGRCLAVVTVAGLLVLPSGQVFI